MDIVFCVLKIDVVISVIISSTRKRKKKNNRYTFTAECIDHQCAYFSYWIGYVSLKIEEYVLNVLDAPMTRNPSCSVLIIDMWPLAVYCEDVVASSDLSRPGFV